MAKGNEAPPTSEPRVLIPHHAKILAQKSTAGERAEKRSANKTHLADKYASLRMEPASAASKTGPSLAPKSRISSAFSRLSGRIAAVPGLAGVGRFTSIAFRVALVVAPIFPISYAIRENVMRTIWVNGPSMTPYLNEDWAQMHTERDLVLMNKWLWKGPWGNRYKRFERGMVVAFQSPANTSNIAIKRIIGLPGDRITTREPCLKPSVIVPWNHVWVEGDAEDPKKSLDSNTYGPVSVSLVQGHVTKVLLPRWRSLDWRDWEAGKGNDSTAEKYRQSVRDRVEKEAVQIQRPNLGGEWS